jgi:hypothetical protein
MHMHTLGTALQDLRFHNVLSENSSFSESYVVSAGKIDISKKCVNFLSCMALYTKAVTSSETSVTLYQSSRCNTPEELNLQ